MPRVGVLSVDLPLPGAFVGEKPNISTPRTGCEFLDFTELDAAEEQLCVEEPCRSLRDIQVGKQVRVVNNAAALLHACRKACIGSDNDRLRISSLGVVGIVVEKDKTDNTVLCSIAQVGDVWFPISVLACQRADGESITSCADVHEGTRASLAAAQQLAAPTRNVIKSDATGIEHDVETLLAQRLASCCLHRPDELGCGVNECVLGVLLTVDTEPAKEIGPRRQAQKLFCDALNEELARFQGSFAQGSPLISGLRKRLGAIVAFLNGLLQYHFLCETIKHPKNSFINSFITYYGHKVESKITAKEYCQRLADLFAGRLRSPGLYEIAGQLNARMCGYAQKPSKCAVEDQAGGFLLDVLESINGLLGWVHWPQNVDKKRVEATFVDISSLAMQRFDEQAEDNQDLQARDSLMHLATWRGALLAGADLEGASDHCTWLEWAVEHRHAANMSSTILRTSPISATKLLHEIRELVRKSTFQAQYQEALMNNSRNHIGWNSILLASPGDVGLLARYGFAMTVDGIRRMREELQCHIHYVRDKAVAKLWEEIDTLLDVRAGSTSPIDHQGLIAERVAPTAKRFHTVGDSHCGNGWPAGVAQHYVGSILCYNIQKVRLDDLEPEIASGDTVCFCFGEIDCRCHVHKHCDIERTYREVIDDIIFRYFRYLREQSAVLPVGVNIAVYNVLPPVWAHIMYHREGVMAYPWAGSDEERLSYVRYFNYRLQAECGVAGYTFFDVYDEYATADGFLRMDMSDGGVHAAEQGPLKAFIERHFPDTVPQSVRACSLEIQRQQLRIALNT